MMTSLQDLPVEILSLIFADVLRSDLRGLPLVCKLFNTVLADPVFWKDMCMRDRIVCLHDDYRTAYFSASLLFARIHGVNFESVRDVVKTVNPWSRKATVFLLRDNSTPSMHLNTIDLDLRCVMSMRQIRAGMTAQPPRNDITQVAVSNSVRVALDSEGNVYIGGSHHKRLSHKASFGPCMSIAAGERFVVAVTRKGSLFGSGSGLHCKHGPVGRDVHLLDFYRSTYRHVYAAGNPVSLSFCADD